MSPGHLGADTGGYRQAAAANTPPPVVVSDPLADGLSPIEQLVRILGLAANLGDERDNTDGIDDYAERDLLTTGAADEFTAQDEQAAEILSGANDSATQMVQQIPQMAAGIAGSLAGALSGAVQPFTQIPQQLAQGAQQAMQAGLSMAQRSESLSAPAGFDDGDDPLLDEFTTQADDPGDPAFGSDLGAGGVTSGGGGGSLGGAAVGSQVAGILGPPAPPSAGTFPSAVRSAVPAPPVAPPHAPAPAGGMTGVPMVPPTAMNGAGAADRDARTETRRVSVPPMRNGAPVQGRLTAPPATPESTGPGIRTVQGKPVATRRILVTREEDPAAVDPAGRG